jgi:hypothetical protein
MKLEDLVAGGGPGVDLGPVERPGDQRLGAVGSDVEEARGDLREGAGGVDVGDQAPPLVDEIEGCAGSARPCGR